MKKFLKNIIFFFLVILVINHLFVWIYEAPKRAAIENNTYVKKLKWDAIQNKNNKIDIIILGSSRAYNAYNPKVLDSILNLNSFNMGTGSQNIVESYFMLKEILEHQNPKMVVFDLFSRSIEYNAPDYMHVLGNAEFFSMKNHADMLVNGFGSDGITHTVFPLLKYKNYLEQDLSGGFQNSSTSNWHKGYSRVDYKISIEEAEALGPTVKFKDEQEAQEKLKHYLEKIKNLCDENKVKLICIRSPYPPQRISKDSSSDKNLSNLFASIAKDLQVPFYDLNYYSNEYTHDDFFDFHHMNFEGSKKVSVRLSEILSLEKEPIRLNTK